MKKIIAAAGVMTALAGSMVPSVSGAATNLIQNGDFEQSAFGNRQANINWTSIFDLNDITDWTVNYDLGANVFYYQNAEATTGADGVSPISKSFDNIAYVPGSTLQPNGVQQDPETGGHFVALDGNSISAGDNSMYQMVSGLTPGQAYTLSFYWGAAQLQVRDGPTTEHFNVTFGNQTESTPTVQEGTHYFSGWMQETMDFVATSATQKLTFQAYGTPIGLPPMLTLDGVSLTATTTPPPPPVSAVPEASSWAMLLMGCVGIGGHALARRRSGKGKGQQLG